MRKRKVWINWVSPKGFNADCTCLNISVDENLFYKGVDKSAVHGARLSQTQAVSDLLLDNVPPSMQVQHQHTDIQVNGYEKQNDPTLDTRPIRSSLAIVCWRLRGNIMYAFICGADLLMSVLTS
jgi:hypothetical protein